MLTRYVNGDKTVTMQYDAKGIRRFKQAPALIEGYKYTLYVYDNEGRLRAETTNVSGTNFRYYLYSSDGIIGYEENGERFLYRKNLFGDITAIYKGTTKVAEYEYDAWGNCTITLNTRNYGTNNPFRYRGYYWDNDLEMYYLMSRYYDPKTGRFINADSFEYLDPNKINGLNLYAYCRNNPVMYKDPSGHFLLEFLAVIGSLIVATFVAEVSVSVVLVGIITVGEIIDRIVQTAKSVIKTSFDKFKDFIGFLFGTPSSSDVDNLTTGLLGGASTPYYDPEPDLFPDDLKINWE